MKAILLLLLAYFLTACATSVKPIKKDSDVHLKKGTGYLLMGVAADRQLDFIQITGPDLLQLTAHDLRNGSRYLLVSLKAGRYRIQRLQLNSYYYIGLNNEYWEFDVSPDQISYVGTLELNSRGFWSNVELVNRSSEALEFMESSFPNILSSRKLAFGGAGSDDFFTLLEISEKEVGQ